MSDERACAATYIEATTIDAAAVHGILYLCPRIHTHTHNLHKNTPFAVLDPHPHTRDFYCCCDERASVCGDFTSTFNFLCIYAWHSYTLAPPHINTHGTPGDSSPSRLLPACPPARAAGCSSSFLQSRLPCPPPTACMYICIYMHSLLHGG